MGVARLDKKIRISLQLNDPKSVPLTNVFRDDPTKRCLLREGGLLGGIPPSLHRVNKLYSIKERSGRVLDFTATISSNLKLLLIGDSVMIQLAQAFDEMLGGHELNSRNILWEMTRTYHKHRDVDGGSFVGPTRGGGVSATWRMTGLLSKSNKGRKPANSRGGGWSDVEIDKLLNHEYPDPSSNGQTLTKVGAFDAVIFRVMHGWMHHNEITHDRLVEAIELSNELFGAKTVILMNIPFTNNVKTMEDYLAVQAINNDIQDIANKWHLRYKDLKSDGDRKGVENVLVQDFDAFYKHVIWSNARHIGYNVSFPLTLSPSGFDSEGWTFLFDRLSNNDEYPPSIPMVCANKTLNADKSSCDRNILWLDGMHLCAETLAARHSASLACLLGCVYNKRGSVDEENESVPRECERDCNEQFMSVMPVDEDWIGTNTTLASFS